MEIDSLKTQLGNLLALHRDDDANEDDIVFATVDYMKRAHDVAQMLLLEGRFQELQRCLHLCQAAFGDTSNVRASVVGRSGSFAPFLSFVGGAASDDAEGTVGTEADQRTSSLSADGGAAGDHQPHNDNTAATRPLRPLLFELQSEEDQRVFAALQSRTAQLRRQMEAAMRVRRGRDTEYYMQRLGLHEKGAASTTAAARLSSTTPNNAARVHVQQLPALGSRLHNTSVATAPLPSRGSRERGRVSVIPPPSQASATTALVAVTEPRQPWTSPGAPTCPSPPAPPERGVSFGVQVHFSRGKGRMELPPLVTSGRLFGVAYDNPTSVQHTVFGSSLTAPPSSTAASFPQQRQQQQQQRSVSDTTHGGHDDDFGIGAVETVFGVEGAADEVPLHLRPIPDGLRLWSSSSSTASSHDTDSSPAGDSAAFSMYVERAVSPPPIFAERQSLLLLPGDAPLVSGVRPTPDEDEYDGGNGVEGEEGGAVFSSLHRGRLPSVQLRQTLRSSMLFTPMHSVGSVVRRATAVGPTTAASADAATLPVGVTLPTTAVGSGNDSTLLLLNSAVPPQQQQQQQQQPQRIAPDITPSGPAQPPTSSTTTSAGGTTVLTRPNPPSWQQLMTHRRRSGDAYGMNATNSTFTASSSRTLVSMVESASATMGSATTGTSTSDQQLAHAPPQNLTPAAREAAKVVEAARQTTQYVFSSIKAQHLRSEQALLKCDSFDISRLPYSARHAILAARTAAAAEERQAHRRASAGPSAAGSSSISISISKDASPVVQHLFTEDWSPTSLLLNTSTPMSHAASSMPASPATAGTLASPILSALSAGASPPMPSVPAAVPQHSLSRAAEQQLLLVRATYEKQMAMAAGEVRDMEARWVQQHRQLQTHASMPPLENIAEWRKRRGRQRQRHGVPHGGREGSGRLGHMRHRSRGPPPVPPPVTPTAGAARASVTTSPLARAAVLGKDAVLLLLDPRSPEHRTSRSPSLASTTATRESRRSSYKSDEGSGASSRSSSDVARRASHDGVSALPPNLITPVDRDALPLMGLAGTGQLASLKQALRLSRRNSPETPVVLLTNAEGPPPPPPTADNSGDGSSAANAADLVKGGRDDGSCVGVGAEVTASAGDDGQDVRSDGADDDDTALRGNTSEEIAAASASREEETVLPKKFTYHPAVAAIVEERQLQRQQQQQQQQRRATLLSSTLATSSSPLAPETTEATLAAWQHTLRAVAGNEARQPPRLAAAEGKEGVGGVHASGGVADAARAGSVSPRVGRSRRANTEISLPATTPQKPPPEKAVMMLPGGGMDANPLRRHGIVCGAAAIRSRHARDVLSAAIREASSHIRAEDVVIPAWRRGTAGRSASTSLATTSMTFTGSSQRVSPPPPPSSARNTGQLRSFVDYPDVFSTRAEWRTSPTTAPAGGDAMSMWSTGGEVGREASLSRLRPHGRSAPTALSSATTAGRIREGSLISATAYTATATPTLTPVVLSLTAKALAPHTSDPEFVPLPIPPPLPSFGNDNARHYLHASYRVRDALQAAPDWTRVAPTLLGRSLPLCLAAVRLQRWWRQRLACAALRVRQAATAAHLVLEQRRDAAALSLQRQLRVHWARVIVSRRRAVCAAATEYRVASENPIMSALARVAAGGGGASSGGFVVTVEGLSSASGAWTASSTSSRQLQRANHRLVSTATGSDERSRASFGDGLSSPGGGTGTSTGEMRRLSSQLSGPLAHHGFVALGTGRQNSPASPPTAADVLLADADTPPWAFSAKDPWAVTTPRAASPYDHPIHHHAHVTKAPAPTPVTASLSPVVEASSTHQSKKVAVPHVAHGSHVPSRPLSISSTLDDVQGSTATAPMRADASGCMAEEAAASQHPASPTQQRTAADGVVVRPQDPAGAAQRIQRWYRRRSAEETAQLCHEVEVLASVVTGRALLTAVRDALRPHVAAASVNTGEREREEDEERESWTETSASSASVAELLETGFHDEAADTSALLAKCTGDVYQAYLKRAAAARQRGDYKTPLEHVSLRALQRARQEREDEAKQRRVLQERQQRLRLEQQQRRERQMVDAVKLMQRVGRGLRWRRWLRERQCRDLHYRATHTLDLLSQTDMLGATGGRRTEGQRRRAGYGNRKSGSMSTSAEEQRVHLAGGPRVTAHVMARLRSAHPSWFGLDVDHESAAWIVQNASTEQLAALATVQSFVAAFSSSCAVYGQHQHACARCIQLAWRLHRERRRQTQENGLRTTARAVGLPRHAQTL